MTKWKLEGKRKYLKLFNFTLNTECLKGGFHSFKYFQTLKIKL